MTSDHRPPWQRPTCSSLCRPDEHTLRCDRAARGEARFDGPVGSIAHLAHCAGQLTRMAIAERRRPSAGDSSG